MWVEEIAARESEFESVARACAAVTVLVVSIVVWPVRVGVGNQHEVMPRSVVVVPVTEHEERPELTLHGVLVANQRTLITAQADGYVRRVLVDIGDRVTTGEIVAELDLSEVDSRLASARASMSQQEAELRQLEASARWARLRADRAVELAARGLIARTEGDHANEQAAFLNAKVSDAERALRAARDDVHRVEELSRANYVRAPLEGSITRRFVGIGTPTHGGAGATALLEVATVDELSVSVMVPSRDAWSIRASVPAQLTVLQHPNRVFEGHVTRIVTPVNALQRFSMTRNERGCLSFAKRVNGGDHDRAVLAGPS
jgi:RND family efflux transporter MFP subunit